MKLSAMSEERTSSSHGHITFVGRALKRYDSFEYRTYIIVDYCKKELFKA